MGAFDGTAYLLHEHVERSDVSTAELSCHNLPVPTQSHDNLSVLSKTSTRAFFPRRCVVIYHRFALQASRLRREKEKITSQAVAPHPLIPQAAPQVVGAPFTHLLDNLL